MKKRSNVENSDGIKFQMLNSSLFAEFSTMQTNNKQQDIGVLWLIIAGALIGFVNGFCGGGGGMICVPILVNLLKLPDKKGHATTILIMLPLCITSFIVYLIKGGINVGLSINVGIGFIVGGILGAMLLKKINNVALQLIFAAVIIIAGVKLLL